MYRSPLLSQGYLRSAALDDASSQMKKVGYFMLALFAVGFFLSLIPEAALANTRAGRGRGRVLTSSEAPWRAAFQVVIDEMTGETGRLIGIGLLIIGGITWGFTRHQKGANKIGQGVIAMGVIISASSLTNVLFESAVM